MAIRWSTRRWRRIGATSIPVGLRSCYDESKRYAEAMTMAYHRVYGVRTNIARIFNTYGPRMALDDGRVVPAFLDQALRGEPLTVFGDGSQTRSFCYVSDMVEGLVRLAASEERYPVNLGNPDGTDDSRIREKHPAPDGIGRRDRSPAAAVRRSAQAPPGYFQSSTHPGMGTGGYSGRRIARDGGVL